MTYSKFLRDGDDGFNLIELIVAIAVASILLSAVATVLFNSWRTQEKVGNVTESTNSSQIIGSMIERAVRNAKFVVALDDELLVHTTLGGALTCQGFRIEGDEVRVATATLTLPANFPAWEPAIEVANSGAIFGPTPDGMGVSYQMAITANPSSSPAPVRITGEAASRNDGVRPKITYESDPDGCW